VGTALQHSGMIANPGAFGEQRSAFA